jgi:hypothetical protein
MQQLSIRYSNYQLVTPISLAASGVLAAIVDRRGWRKQMALFRAVFPAVVSGTTGVQIKATYGVGDLNSTGWSTANTAYPGPVLANSNTSIPSANIAWDTTATPAAIGTLVGVDSTTNQLVWNENLDVQPRFVLYTLTNLDATYPVIVSIQIEAD